MNNKVSTLFNVQYPIVQGGMVWTSGWQLASAVSNAGGLGLVGAGSMHPETLEIHLQKCLQATDQPFGVNVPLLYPEMDRIIELILQYKVPIVFTSAGNPAVYTARLKAAGCIVVHVVSSVKFALKAQACGVDAVVAEGFEAGGHNGREETTTFTLIPAVCKAVDIPVLAAGGIATGSGMLAAMALGADGVQVGSRFAITHEASSHPEYKKRVVEAGEGSTALTLKELTPVRLLKSPFYDAVQKAYAEGASTEELQHLLGKGRAKKGIFEGDWEAGEFEIGQAAQLIDAVETAEKVIRQMIADYNQQLNHLNTLGPFDS